MIGLSPSRRPVVDSRSPILKGTQESEHVPPGQAPPHIGASPHESHVGAAAVLPTAKPERSLVTSDPPHFSQAGGLAVRLFCSTSITCPHFPHLNSKIGISSSLLAKSIRRKARSLRRILCYSRTRTSVRPTPRPNRPASGIIDHRTAEGHTNCDRSTAHENRRVRRRVVAASAACRWFALSASGKAFGLAAATRHRRPDQIRVGAWVRSALVLALGSGCPYTAPDATTIRRWCRHAGHRVDAPRIHKGLVSGGMDVTTWSSPLRSGDGAAYS